MEYSRINSFVALRDLDGLPGASNFPYFFLEDGVGDVSFAKSKSVVLLESMLFSLDEMLLDDTCELVLLFTVCGERNGNAKNRNQLRCKNGNGWCEAFTLFEAL